MGLRRWGGWGQRVEALGGVLRSLGVIPRGQWGVGLKASCSEETCKQGQTLRMVLQVRVCCPKCPQLIMNHLCGPLGQLCKRVK